MNKNMMRQAQKQLAQLQKIQEESTLARKHLMFYELEWVELDEKKAATLINDKKLEKYRHFLEQERKYKKTLDKQIFLFIFRMTTHMSLQASSLGKGL